MKFLKTGIKDREEIRRTVKTVIPVLEHDGVGTVHPAVYSREQGRDTYCTAGEEQGEVLCGLPTYPDGICRPCSSWALSLFLTVF